jgi:glutamate N-acetyltransferase/amino-acid N-acetyltransferase
VVVDGVAQEDVAVAPHLAPLPSPLPAVERRAVLPDGFVATAATAGIKASGRPDLALITVTSGAPAAAAAGVFTRNAFAAAPVRLSRDHLAATEPAGGGGYGRARAIVSTSGCANAATGSLGDADQLQVARATAAALGVPVEEVLCLSTGMIGTRLPVDRVAAALERLAAAPARASHEGLQAAAEALCTTDSRLKVATATITIPDPDGMAVRPVRVSGIAKGVGMIHPGMATMLAVLLTDAPVAPAVLHGLLRHSAARTWNQLTVDGDTSTNDTVLLLASGAADTAEVAPGSVAATSLRGAIEAVARDLARQQAADGEGASTLITCQVSGAHDEAEARAVARAVVASSLVKAAVHGRDPNWGRIAGAAGNARLADAAVLEAAGLAAGEAELRGGRPVLVDPDTLRIAIAGHLVFDGGNGGPVDFDREAARAAMDAAEVLVRLDLGQGDGTGEGFGCDLTEEYVRENSEYST